MSLIQSYLTFQSQIIQFTLVVSHKVGKIFYFMIISGYLLYVTRLLYQLRPCLQSLLYNQIANPLNVKESLLEVDENVP